MAIIFVISFTLINKSTDSDNKKITSGSISKGVFSVIGKAPGPSMLEKSNNYYRAIPTLTSLPSGESLGLVDIKIYVFNKHQDYEIATRKPAWSDGYTSVRNNSIYLFLNENTMNSTLPHEISHLFFDNYMGFEDKKLNWIDEGLASLVQVNFDFKQAKSLSMKMDLIRNNNFVPLKRLQLYKLREATEKQNIELYYTQSLSLVAFLSTNTLKWKNFLKILKSRRTQEIALNKAYGLNFQEFENEWLKSIKSNKQSWEKSTQ